MHTENIQLYGAGFSRGNALFTPIREALGSNPRWNTEHRDRDFCDFRQTIYANSEVAPRSHHDCSNSTFVYLLTMSTNSVVKQLCCNLNVAVGRSEAVAGPTLATYFPFPVLSRMRDQCHRLLYVGH
jgi:hypothetical protein